MNLFDNIEIILVLNLFFYLANILTHFINFVIQFFLLHQGGSILWIIQLFLFTLFLLCQKHELFNQPFSFFNTRTNTLQNCNNFLNLFQTFALAVNISVMLISFIIHIFNLLNFKINFIYGRRIDRIQFVYHHFLDTRHCVRYFVLLNDLLLE